MWVAKKFVGQPNVEQPENCPKRALWKRLYSAKETYDSRMWTFCISMISRLLEIIGLVCKKAPWIRLYSAKGTCNSRIYSCPKLPQMSLNDSCQMCEWVIHVTHMNESCHICEWVMSHIWMSHVAYVSESCHTYGWVMSHMWVSHVTHMKDHLMRHVKSCTWVSHITHTWVSHITHMNESCPICEWVMSHIWMSQVTYVTESCHPYEWLPKKNE